MQIHLKSVAIGFIIGVAVMLVFHLYEPGSYQHLQGGYILNTRTGKVFLIKYPPSPPIKYPVDWTDLGRKTNPFDLLDQIAATNKIDFQPATN